MEGRMGVPEEEPITDINMDPDIDECCQNAQMDFRALFGELANMLRESGNYDPDDAEIFAEGFDIVGLMEARGWKADHPDFCAYFRSEIERISQIPNTDMDNSEWQFMMEGTQQIITEWDACNAQKQGGDFVASNDTFEDAWRVLKIQDWRTDNPEPSWRPYRSTHEAQGGYWDPESELATDGRSASVDSCCEEARGKLLAATAMTPYDPENGWEGPNLENTTCDELRGFWEEEVERLKREEYGVIGIDSFIEEIAEIMLEWDECGRGENQDIMGMPNIRASRDAFTDAWDLVKAELEEPMVDVATTEGDECCEKVRKEFKDYLIWAAGHGDKNAGVIGWLVDGAECESLYGILEDLAHTHPRAREFLQMWDDCSSEKNAEGME
jgi:hypothetical protein